MQTTQHAMQRMSQRGVTGDMVDFVLNYGFVEQDKYVLGKRQALELLNDLKKQERLVKKILDKGGVTVVAQDDVLITTYNCNSYKPN
ncbi:DUF4258 domain-containing protein [Polynucleobacter hirudinilacicola]|jgi:hypothetical protein|uniref:DUF4258 domain-containing protein n=1 Tax=Polynucleobacter hirudinilacicola TaxID=1743166 RepID=A0A210RVW3_9BURK|nr:MULTISPECIES: DUF4258 domain-containing protein [Polynucleobacter]MBT8539448.1 DUF4258 domain-containing protein [Polynucleobacter paneuropaeus]OWF65094.1 DUF4258 domain-containing protein [Polynucleobacter hirudinilacicola]QWD36566.1 DUF4258 domain-containing protein [Polynucleobacter paneuropaeus]RAZ47546.1 DUF4258 domain-containing protein [Polynucleobacter paneuropaeus]